MNRKTLFTVLTTNLLMGGAILLAPFVDAAMLTKEDEKKAASAASNDADKWAATQQEPEKPAAVVPVAPPPPSASVGGPATSEKTTTEKQKPVDPPSATESSADALQSPSGRALKTAEDDGKKNEPASKQSAKTVAATPAPPKATLNEMVGKISAVEADARIVRLALDGGYSIEFTYDTTTAITNGGTPLKATDLYYGDKVEVKYAGKDLKAIVIERLEKAPRPFAE